MKDISEVERIYDRLAESIDQAGERSELFLVKLVLLLAHECGDASTTERLIDTALKDL